MGLVSRSGTEVEYQSPPTADVYIAPGSAATENIVNDAVEPEFDGHYADNVMLSFRLIPEPSTVTLLVAVLLGWGWRDWEINTAVRPKSVEPFEGMDPRRPSRGVMPLGETAVSAPLAPKLHSCEVLALASRCALAHLYPEDSKRNEH